MPGWGHLAVTLLEGYFALNTAGLMARGCVGSTSGGAELQE